MKAENVFEYAPAPESRDLARLKPSYQIFVDGRFRDGAARRSRRSTRPTRPRWPRSPRPGRPTSTTRCARPVAPTTARGRRCPARSGASTCSASPGRSRSAGASWPCSSPWTTASDPRVARRRHPDGGGALLLLRGLGRQARVRRVRPGTAPARGRGADHPVELPAADGGLEDRARAGDRQHRGAQAGRDDTADRARAGRDHRRGRPAAGRREHPGRGPGRRAGDRRARRCRQDRVHRLDRRRQDHPADDGGVGQEADPRARR